MSQVVQVAGPRRGPRSRGPAFRGIVPGAGATAPVAFGATRKPANRRRANARKKNHGGNRNRNLNAWNAFAPQHLSLPRAVGEYTVTRGTRNITTNDKLIFVGTWQYSHDDPTAAVGFGRNWSAVCALGCDDLTATPAQTNWTRYLLPMLNEGLGNHCQVVPSACSVQVMNGNALQTTSGMLYIGKMKVQPSFAGDATITGREIADNFVSYMAPRLCAAAKLALRGIHVDAHPLNMNRLADFTQIFRGFTEATGVWDLGLYPTGFTPIVVYNPNGVELNLLVCHEYRTRFDLFNPASSSHKFHTPTTETDWASMVRMATDLGSGAKDIADVVAKSGLFEQVKELAKWGL